LVFPFPLLFNNFHHQSWSGPARLHPSLFFTPHSIKCINVIVVFLSGSLELQSLACFFPCCKEWTLWELRAGEKFSLSGPLLCIQPCSPLKAQLGFSLPKTWVV
jgi:hypothetical protein